MSTSTTNASAAITTSAATTKAMVSPDGSTATTTMSNYSIESSSVQISKPLGSGPTQSTLDFIHCSDNNNHGGTSEEQQQNHDEEYNNNGFELVLLHGAKFTKQDWITSGLFQMFCDYINLPSSLRTITPDHGDDHTMPSTLLSSVTALDLSVRADGEGLYDAFTSLVSSNILSGQPVTIITPSASGTSVVSLATSASVDDDPTNPTTTTLLKQMIQYWIPVASPAVLRPSTPITNYGIFQKLNIGVLAIHGNNDSMGKKVTSKLVDEANARGVELNGGHPCYLDSPREFVDTVTSFLLEQLQ